MQTSRITTLLLCTFAAVLVYTSCQKKEDTYEVDTLKLPTTPYNYLNGSIRQNPQNPITNEGATLGRVLFYDKNLSINNTIACASCHKQENGFADVTATSEGFKGGRTTRNSLPLVNLSDDSGLFWDSRAKTLEDLVLQPVANHVEMGLDNTENLLKKLNRTSYYPALFQKAFGNQEITQERITKALAQFVRSISSSNSKFDAVRRGAWGVMNESETGGWNLFFNQLQCSGCHNGNDLNNGSIANIGLDMNYKDNGMGTQTGENTLNGFFKVPSLRNVALTAPYMHDGRFKTLEDVVEHYNSGVQNHTNLSSVLRGFLWQGNGALNTSNGNGGFIFGFPSRDCWSCGVGTGGTDFKALNLTKTEKENLVAFLKLTTDETLVRDEKFANPFK